MTLNANIRVFINFLAILGCETLFKGELRRNQLRFEIDMKKLRMKFSALNVDFEGPSLDFLGSRKPATESIKERYPRKRRDEMAGDTNSLWIGTAIGFCTSREH